MIIIADCGSTKTDWALIRGITPPKTGFPVDRETLTAEAADYKETLGFNPNYVGGESFINSAQRLLKDWPLDHKDLKVYFYGSGQTPNHHSLTQQLLRVLFPEAAIAIGHDLDAACRACCGNQPGIIGILGTGSNSCYYDGEKIVDKIPSLGYVLGDEGSGGYIGRLLILDYFYRRMPPHLCEIVEQHYPKGPEDLKKQFLSSTQQNIFLANFGAYFKDKKEDPYYREKMAESFRRFVQNHLTNYSKFKIKKVHFVGSIAFHFADLLEQELEKQGLTLGKIVRKPIEDLVKYHLNPER